MTAGQPAREPSRKNPLSRRVMIGLVAGVAVGLFVGDRAAVLQVVADAYIKLLQMTVLPYVTISIISGLGALNATQARALGKRVAAVLLLLWALALGAVFLFPVMFPSGENASFFSTTLIQEREPFDFLNLYIPSNPFNSLANNVVPAVVLFSMIVGVALIAVPEKASLLAVLKVAGAAVSRATDFIVALMPYGVGAIAAVVAGTLSLDEVRRLEVYLLSYVGIALLLSLWVMPGLVAALTPVPYRSLLSASRDALVLAFMTTSLFAVLPLLMENSKALVRTHATGDEDAAAVTDVIVPASFNFPHTGKLLSLSFVLFAGWFADNPVRVADYPRLAASGLLVMFGNVNAAIPFLLDLFHIPADTFRLFVASGIVNARFGTLVAAVHTLAVAVLGTCAIAGALVVDARKLARFAIVTAVLMVAVLGGTRFVGAAMNPQYEKASILSNMGMLRDRGTATVFHIGEQPPPLAAAASIFERVRERRTLRVGYFEDSLPYAYVNARGELVGFDVEMAHQLARELDVALELVPIDRRVLDTGLDMTMCDVIMSGVAITTERSTRVQFSASYVEETIAFLVPDHLTASFTEWTSVRAMTPLRLGVPRAEYFIRKIRDELKDVEIVPIDRMEQAFEPHDPPIDAFVTTAERGSAYTLLHPQYSVAVPKPRPFKVPLAYVIAGRDGPMTSMVDTWIDLKRKDGTIDALFAHWILGEDSVVRRPRWSVMRDVLRWTR